MSNLLALLSRIAQRKAVILGILHKTAEKDVNHLTDVYETQNVTPIPYPVAEVSPIGLYDGIYPEADEEGKPLGSLFYGEMSEHYMADTATIEEAQEQTTKPSTKPTTNKKASKR